MTMEDPAGSPVPHGAEDTPERKQSQNRVIVMIVALAAASVAFRLLNHVGLRHSAVVFIGLPTLMAVIVVRSRKPATGVGVVMRVITLALLLSSIVFAEAMICIILAAPIFYVVGFLVAKAIQEARAIGRRNRGMMMLMLILLPR